MSAQYVTYSDYWLKPDLECEILWEEYMDFVKPGIKNDSTDK